MRLDGYLAAELPLDKEFKIPVSVRCLQLLSRFHESQQAGFNG